MSLSFYTHCMINCSFFNLATLIAFDVQPRDPNKYFNEIVAHDPDMECIFSIEIVNRTAFSIQRSADDNYFAIAGIIAVSITFGPMFAVGGISYRHYLRKMRELKKILKSHIQKVNQMLFFVVTLQILLIFIFAIIPAWILISPLVFHAFFGKNLFGNYENVITQFYFFALGIYPIFDNLILLCFVKNYRHALKRYTFRMLCLKTATVHVDSTYVPNTVISKLSRTTEEHVPNSTSTSNLSFDRCFSMCCCLD